MQQSIPGNRFGSYLNQRHFLGTILLAILLHAGGAAIYQILPREVIEMIPVRVLNIKIGKAPPESNVPAEGRPVSALTQTHEAVKSGPNVPKQRKAPTVKPTPESAKKPEKIIKSAVVAPAPEGNPFVPTPQSATGKTISAAAREAAAQQQGAGRQYIREESSGGEIQGGVPAGYGSPLGNSREASAEIERRYTQTLSLWINRFKIYPVEARRAGIGGMVMLRLRINRQGRILQYYLEKSSGHEVIDQAISAMVNAANPVPAVPPYYPDSRPYLEFLVPIHFKP